MKRYQILDRENGTRNIAFEQDGAFFLLYEEYFRSCGWLSYGMPDRVSEELYNEALDSISAWMYEDITEYIGDKNWCLAGSTLEELKADLEDAGFCDEDIRELYADPDFIDQWNNIHEETQNDL